LGFLPWPLISGRSFLQGPPACHTGLLGVFFPCLLFCSPAVPTGKCTDFIVQNLFFIIIILLSFRILTSRPLSSSVDVSFYIVWPYSSWLLYSLGFICMVVSPIVPRVRDNPAIYILIHIIHSSDLGETGRSLAATYTPPEHQQALQSLAPPQEVQGASIVEPL
jgi:hypothetical protein